MLSLSRFGSLLGTYGADPRRWPEAMRSGALALLACSEEARRLQEQARSLDQDIDAALAMERPGQSQQDAMVARLRMRTAARLATSAARPSPGGRRAGLLHWLIGGTPDSLYVTGLIGGVSVAVVTGLIIGALWSSAPAPHASMMAVLLQSSPLQILDVMATP